MMIISSSSSSVFLCQMAFIVLPPHSLYTLEQKDAIPGPCGCQVYRTVLCGKTSVTIVCKLLCGVAVINVATDLHVYYLLIVLISIAHLIS